jgi:translation initiation factor 1
MSKKNKTDNQEDYVLVWSDDGSHLNQKVIPEVAIEPSQLNLKIRLEKNARGGKQVTVIFNFPYNPTYFKNMLKQLKNRCGVGGAYKDDQLELQGDQREKVREYLSSLKIKSVLAGG